ncbi:MAG: tRNA (N6-isopentenyl adenosine(37)-C2)-methylthiotransferase MiaB, partial [Micrococcales bacterium]|nr:tRNA (N6-isopentenyl adenosine(37)-C2)-methylthiotransferase MiaB [Micrococcales bacterium]
EDDFAATLDVVEAARFASAFTFQYSPRPGTPAANMPDQVPPQVVTERYDRLVAVTERLALAGNRELVGRTVEVLLAQPGRKDAATDRLSGRAADNRLVHLALPPGADRPRPGDLVRATVTHAAPHHLVADSGLAGGLFEVRRTRAGDAWQGPGAPDQHHAGAPTGGAQVSLGLPLVRP